MDANDFAFFCPRCQHGRCHAQAATYARVEDGQMIVVPAMPVYVCDVCGYTEFEREAVAHVSRLLGSEAPDLDASGSTPSPYASDETGEPAEPRHPNN